MARLGVQPDKECPECSKSVPFYNDHCFNCGYDYPASNAAHDDAPDAPLPPSLTRSYHGSPEEIESLRRADEKSLATKEYFPKSQNFVPGSWGTGAYLLGVVLILVFGLGLLVLIYLVAVKPAGTLTVVYERTGEPQALKGAVESPQGSEPNHADRLRRLEALKTEGLISTEEYTAKRTAILEDL